MNSQFSELVIKKLRIPTVTIILLSALYVIVRVALILWSPYVSHGEELKQASLGVHLLKGSLEIPFWCYLDSPHSGGSIFTSIILMPFLVIFQYHYVALKVAALTYSAATFIIIIRMITKYYSVEDIKFPLFVLFVVSTPHFLQKNLNLTGNSVELIFIGFLFISLFLFIVEKKSRNSYLFLLLGIIAGLGLWIQYLFISFLIAFFIIRFFSYTLNISVQGANHTKTH